MISSAGKLVQGRSYITPPGSEQEGWVHLDNRTGIGRLGRLRCLVLPLNKAPARHFLPLVCVCTVLEKSNCHQGLNFCTFAQHCVLPLERGGGLFCKSGCNFLILTDSA